MVNLDNMQKYLDTDWTKIPQIFFIVILFLISRIPLLNTGFGSDPDAWRIANSAFDLNNFFYYEPSRFPGYPLPEFANSIIINYGWLATNSLTMLLSLISLLVFAKILNELNIKNKGLILITYAFFPILWIYSTTTMDYMWALCFIIICWYSLIKKKYIAAGLMIGLAIASRPTSLFALIPFLYWIYKDNNELKNYFSFLFAAFIISVLFFLPLCVKFGTNFITFYPSNPTLTAIWTMMSRYIGPLAIVFLSVELIVNYKVLYEKIKKKEKLIIFLTIALISLLIPFIVAPYQIEYTIPAIIFGLLLFNEIFKKNRFIILCILILLPSLISIAVPLEDDFFTDGLIKKDWEKRNQLLSTTELIIQNNQPNSVVISSEYLAVISYLYEKSSKNPQKIGMVGYGEYESNEHINREKNVRYLYLATSEDLTYFQNNGYKIYYIGLTAHEMTKDIYGYDLDEYNVTNIFNLI